MNVKPHSHSLVSFMGLLKMCLPALIIGLSACLWNFCYFEYVSSSGFSGDIFRHGFQQAYPPVYGKATTVLLSDFIWLTLLLLTIFFLYRYWGTFKYARYFQLIAFAVALYSFSYSETPNRFSIPNAHFSTYLESNHLFASPNAVLSNYTVLQEHLDIHSAHYPPGNLWLIKAFSYYSSVTLLKYVLYFLLLLSISICIALAEVQIPFFIICIPALFIYSSIDLVVIPFFLFSSGLWVLFNMKHKWLKVILLGMIGCIWLLFSYTVVVFWMFVLFFDLAQNRSFSIYKFPFINYFLMAVFTLLPFVALYYVTDFSLLVNFQKAVKHNVHINSNYFDTVQRYLFRSTGNILEFFLGMGLPVALIIGPHFVIDLKYQPLRLAFLVTIGIAACSSLFFMETDRVWFFLVSPVIILSSQILSRFPVRQQKVYLFLSVIYVVYFELAAVHYY